MKVKNENQDVKQNSKKQLRRLKRRDLLQFLLESEEELQQVKQTLAQERILHEQKCDLIQQKYDLLNQSLSDQILEDTEEIQGIINAIQDNKRYRFDHIASATDSYNKSPIIEG